MCACVSSKKGGRRDQLWYLSSPCISITHAPSFLLSLHLSPSSLSFLRKITTWLLTLIFQHLSECDRLSFVSPSPPLSLPTSIHSPLSFPAPTSSCHLLIVPPTIVQSYHVTGEREREMEKTKTNQAQTDAALLGYQAVSLWVLWHVRDHEPTMRRCIALPWCTPLVFRLRRTQAVFQTDRINEWSHPQRQTSTQNRGVCMSLCVFVNEKLSCTWATSAHEFPLEKHLLPTKHQ